MTKPLPEGELTLGFWLNVDKNGPVPPHKPELGPCWLWMGSTDCSGYGLCSFEGRTVLAHRVSYIKEYGRIPKSVKKKRLILHHCDNRPCVRPSHLFRGTQKKNMQDMYAKGRGPTGPRNGSHTKPWRRATGNRNGSRTMPKSRPRGSKHYLRQHPERMAGERNPNHTLSNADVQAMRHLHKSGFTQTALGEMFHVAQSYVSRVVRHVSR
jgi:hypothetical protein